MYQSLNLILAIYIILLKNGDKFMYIKLILGETKIIYNDICIHWYYCDYLKIGMKKKYDKDHDSDIFV